MGKMRKRRKFFKLFSCLGRQADEEEAGGGPELETLSGSSPPPSSVAAASAAATATSRDRGGASAFSDCRQPAITVRICGVYVNGEHIGERRCSQ